ncbi:hypothetical protein [Salmonella enterica]
MAATMQLSRYLGLRNK